MQQLAADACRGVVHPLPPVRHMRRCPQISLTQHALMVAFRAAIHCRSSACGRHGGWRRATRVGRWTVPCKPGRAAIATPHLPLQSFRCPAATPCSPCPRISFQLTSVSPAVVTSTSFSRQPLLTCTRLAPPPAKGVQAAGGRGKGSGHPSPPPHGISPCALRAALPRLADDGVTGGGACRCHRQQRVVVRAERGKEARRWRHCCPVAERRCRRARPAADPPLTPKQHAGRGLT